MNDAENDASRDSFGCPAVTDFRTEGRGPILLTRCSRKAGHEGKHNNPRTKSWRDNQTTWLVTPPSLAIAADPLRYADGCVDAHDPETNPICACHLRPDSASGQPEDIR